MGNVVDFVAVQADLLAKRFEVSIAFVQGCRAVGITIPQAKAILRWFFELSPTERRIVMKAVLRDQKGQRP